jgi:hypothetical protein
MIIPLMVTLLLLVLILLGAEIFTALGGAEFLPCSPGPMRCP